MNIELLEEKKNTHIFIFRLIDFESFSLKIIRYEYIGLKDLKLLFFSNIKLFKRKGN